MNTIDFLGTNPFLRQILFDSNFLNIIPSGVSLTTDVSCKTIRHNPIAANFLRIEHSEQLPNVYWNNKLLAEDEMPIQRAARFGEEVIGQELEFVWEDGVTKFARWSACPLRDENDSIRGSIATMEDITEKVHMARELEGYKTQNVELIEDNKQSMMRELIIREQAVQAAKLDERFHTSIDTMQDVLEINTSVRDQDGKIVDFIIDYANDASVAKTKMTKEQLIGHRLLEIMPEQIEFGLFEAYCKDTELKNTFLIALSGYAQFEDVERSMKAGVDRHLGKPVDIAALE